VTIAGGPEPPRSRHSQGLSPETKILALLLAEAGLLGVTSASPSYTTVDPAIGAGIQYHLGTIGGVAANVTVDVSVAEHSANALSLNFAAVKPTAPTISVTFDCEPHEMMATVSRLAAWKQR
jgi:hypothetical protein